MAAHRTADATVSAHDARAVTTSDVTIIPVTRGLYVGSTGDLEVTMASGEVITFVGVPTGTLMPLQVTQVRAGSSASSIIALY